MSREKVHEGGPFPHSVKWKNYKIGEDGISGDTRCHYTLKEEGKIIRRLAPYQFETSDPVAEIRRGVEVFEEFDYYEHLHIPHFDVIQANINDSDTFKPFLFIVDRVNGKPLPMVKFLISEREEDYFALTNFLISMTDYAEDKLSNGGFFPNDNMLHNFVYGRDEDGVKKVYMVDLDLRFDSVVANERSGSRQNKYFFISFVGTIVGMILFFERHLGSSLNEARLRLEVFLDSALETSNTHAREAILKLKDYLNA